MILDDWAARGLAPGLRYDGFTHSSSRHWRVDDHVVVGPTAIWDGFDFVSPQEETIMPGSVHPAIRQATDALNDPEVQELVKRLSARGLAVAVPHMHGADGNLVPLPPGLVAYEDDLRVTFPRVSDPVLDEAEPVMWGWDAAAQKPTPLAHCRGKFHH